MKILKILLKIHNFQKSRYFSRVRGGFVISNTPKWYYVSLFIDFLFVAQKSHFLQKNQHLKIWNFKLFWGLGPRIKKSLTFEPQNITLKKPPVSNRVIHQMSIKCIQKLWFQLYETFPNICIANLRSLSLPALWAENWNNKQNLIWLPITSINRY